MNERRRAFQFALMITLLLRLITSLVLSLASEVSPIDACLYKGCDPQVYAQLNETWFGQHFLAPWYRWDTVHYLDLADPGYQNLGYEGSIWPPLYPWLIRLFSVILPDMVAALLISTLSCLFLFYLLYREVDIRWGEAVAKKAVVLLAFFPTGFFLMAGYTEALFIALSLGVFSAIRTRNWWAAGLFGALATLTRHQGIFLCLPIAWQGVALLRAGRQPANSNAKPNTPFTDQEIFKIVGAFVMIAAALSINYCVVHFLNGAPWPWQTYSSLWGRHLSFPGMGLFNLIRLFFEKNTQSIWANMYLDAFALVLLSVSLLIKRKEIPPGMFLYGIVMLLFQASYVSGIHSTMDAVSRYMLVVFPSFITLGMLLKGKLPYLVWICFSMTTHVLMLYYFYLWMWVA